MKRIYKFVGVAAYNAVRHAENMRQTFFERRNDGCPLKRPPGGTLPAVGWWPIFHCRGTLIHNAIFCATTETPPPLSITLIQFRFLCSSVAQSGFIHLSAAGFGAAGLAAVFVSTVAMSADVKHCPAFRKIAK
jgi:hypothetical protein